MSEEKLDKLHSHISKLIVVAWDGQKSNWIAFKNRLFVVLDSSPRDLRLYLVDDRFHSPDVPVADRSIHLTLWILLQSLR